MYCVACLNSQPFGITVVIRKFGVFIIFSGKLLEKTTKLYTFLHVHVLIRNGLNTILPTAWDNLVNSNPNKKL